MLRRQRAAITVAAVILCSLPCVAATFTVTTTNDVGPGSLRQALLDAAAQGGGNTIAFSIGLGPQTIAIANALPPVTANTTIDATTQPGYSGTPLIELSYSSGPSTLQINGGGVVLRALAINGNSGNGNAAVRVMTTERVDISRCYIGIDLTGTSARPNYIGISALNNTVVTDSVISGNTYGVASTSGQFARNRIGTNASGTAPVPNLFGMTVSGTPAIGDVPGDENVISGNGTGIVINDGYDSLVRHNLIGTDLSGVEPIPNGDGIVLRCSGCRIIDNVIAYNTGDAVRVESGIANVFWRNSMFNNRFGINLYTGAADTGPTPNDGPDDLDTGPNNLTNLPVLTSVTSNGAGTVVQLVPTWFPCGECAEKVQLYVSETCTASGFGEGQRFLGQIYSHQPGLPVTPTSVVQAVLPIALPANAIVTATASREFYRQAGPADPITGYPAERGEETSEFSRCAPVEEIPLQRRKPADFDGNSTADIFWYNIETGETRIWGMWGGSSGTSASRWFDIAGYTMRSRDFLPIGMADFNRDGRDDVVWRNVSTGSIQIWFLNPYTYDVQWVTGLPSASAEWTPLGAGDVDGDGAADLLFRSNEGLHAHDQYGRVVLMDGVTVRSVDRFHSFTLRSTVFAGPGDFKGAGRFGFFEHQGGWNSVHVYGDAAYDLSWQPKLPWFPEWASSDFEDWKVIGLGDFDVDFKDDVLWQNSATGEIRIWHLGNPEPIIVYYQIDYDPQHDRPQRSELRYTAVVEAISLLSEANVADVNGDGASDIIWRDPSSGSQHVWLMNGSRVLADVSLPDLPGTGWHMLRSQ